MISVALAPVKGKWMRVLVIGAYGLIGSYATAGLNRRGHRVVGAGRDAAAARRLPLASWLSIDFSVWRTVEDWQALLEGFDAVVNCAGALQDSPRDDLAAVHLEGPMALYHACRTAGVGRIVHVSAAGVERDRPTAFNATKFKAEAALRQLDIDWVVLRPGLVLAPAAYGGSALLRGLAGYPLFIPAVHATSRVQVVSVEDVAEAIVRAVEAPNAVRGAYDLVAPEPVQLAEVLTQLRAWLGLPVAPIANLPPMVWRSSAGVRRCAAPRSRNCAVAYWAIQLRQSRRSVSNAYRSPKCWRVGRAACKSDGSPNSTSSNPLPLRPWRSSGSFRACWVLRSSGQPRLF